MNEPSVATAGSASTISRDLCCSFAIAAKEMSCEASVVPMITPVSCCGKNPSGTTRIKPDRRDHREHRDDQHEELGAAAPISIPPHSRASSH